MNDDLDNLFKELDDVNNGKFSASGFLSSLDHYGGGSSTASKVFRPNLDEDDKEKDIDQLMRELNLDMQPENNSLRNLGIVMDQDGNIMDSPVRKVSKLDIPGKNPSEPSPFEIGLMHSEPEPKVPLSAGLDQPSFSSLHNVEKKTDNSQDRVSQTGQKSVRLDESEDWFASRQHGKSISSSKELQQQTSKDTKPITKRPSFDIDPLDIPSHESPGEASPAGRAASKTMSASLTNDLKSLLGDVEAFGIKLDEPAPEENEENDVGESSSRQAGNHTVAPDTANFLESVGVSKPSMSGFDIGFEEGDEYLFSKAGVRSTVETPGRKPKTQAVAETDTSRRNTRPIDTSNLNRYGSGVDYNHQQANSNTGVSGELSLPTTLAPKKKDAEDKWIDELEKKIKYQEIEHLYQKTQLDYPKIRQLVQEKNKGLRKKEEIILEKGKEFRLDSHQISPLKVLLDKFDEVESKAVREIRKPRESDFYSALKEASWNSANLSATSFEKNSQVQDMLKGQFTGQLSCFSWAPDGKTLLVVGTTAGEVLELDLVQKKTRKYKLDAKVLSVDVSPDKEKFVAGLENGEIHIRKTYGNWASKSQKIDDRPIMQVRFASKETLICATDFNLYQILIKDLKLMFDLTKRHMVQNSPEIITQLEVMRSKSGTKLITTTMNWVRMFDIQEEDHQLEFEIEKPAYIQEGAVPTVSCLTPDDLQQSYVVLFWHNFVLLIDEDGPNSAVCAMKQLRNPIIWGTVLRNRVICMLFNDFELNLESIQSIFVNLLSGGGFEAKFKLTKQEYSKPRNLSVTNEGAITQSWSEVIRAYGNNIFFLRTDGLFKMYLMTLKEMAYAYSDKGEWLPAFKLCTEVTGGKIRANLDEKAQMKQEVQVLASAYVDRFLDKSKKADELHAQITRVCIDAMISSDNVEFLFKDLRHKFDEITFWREVDTFIEGGLLKKIPVHSIKDGGLYMQSDSLQHIVYHYTLAELSSNEEQFNLLVSTLKRRKLWESLYRLGALAPENTIQLVLSTMLAELMSVCNQQPVKDKIAGFHVSHKDKSTHQSELIDFFEDPKMKCYFRIFWYLHRIVSGNLSPIVDNTRNIESVWTKCLEWMIDPSNLKVMTSAHIGITLETFFDLFMNAEFATSHQVAEHLCSKVQLIKTKLNERSAVDAVDNDVQSLLAQATDENPELTRDLICLALKATVDILLTFADPKYKPDVCFLGLKLVSGGTFKNLLQDYNWIEQLIWTKISTPYVGERLLFHFEQLRKVDCEEKILRVLTVYQKSGKFGEKQDELKAKCLETHFYRVYCHLVEVTENSSKSLREYVRLVDDSNTDYLFNWIKRKLLNPINPEEKLSFSKEIMQHLGYLIKKSKTKAKEIIVMIPNLGVDSIAKLE